MLRKHYFIIKINFESVIQILFKNITEFYFPRRIHQRGFTFTWNTWLATKIYNFNEISWLIICRIICKKSLKWYRFLRLELHFNDSMKGSNLTKRREFYYVLAMWYIRTFFKYKSKIEYVILRLKFSGLNLDQIHLNFGKSSWLIQSVIES